MRQVAGLFVLSAILFSGCRRASDQKPLVGMVPKGANHIFWQTVHAGANKAAGEYGLDLEWNAPALEIDASRQIAIVDSMVNRKLAGIALAPVDRKSLVSVVERAANVGIPVAIFDSDIDTEKRLTYVATDNREGGRLAAQELGRILLGRGKIAVIGFMPGSASTTEREEGFSGEIRTKFPKIQIVQTAFAMADRAKALALTENIMNAHPDLAGLFADNESSASGMMQALKARRGSKLRAVVFDTDEQLTSDLRDHVLDAIVLQDPFKMGYESVKAIGVKLRSQTPPERIDSGVYLIGRSDMEKPNIAALLRPDIERWLKKGPAPPTQH